MPDKLTDSEIKKALECCKQEIDDNGVICGECKKCPNYDGKTGLCKEDLPTFTLDLINRLQAENERLKKGWKADVIETANIKAEAYKESIEKVKEKLRDIAKIEWCDNYYYLVGTAFFDNLLKELVGDDK